MFTPRASPSGAKMVLRCFQRVVIYSHDGIFHPLWVTLVPTDSLAEVLLEAGNYFLHHSPFPTDLDQLPILILGLCLLEGLYPVGHTFLYVTNTSMFHNRVALTIWLPLCQFSKGLAVTISNYLHVPELVLFYRPLLPPPPYPLMTHRSSGRNYPGVLPTSQGTHQMQCPCFSLHLIAKLAEHLSV